MKIVSKSAMLFPVIAGAALTLLVAGGVAHTTQPAQTIVPMPEPFDGSLSVLTYNIHGLPWPFATGRPEAFHRIAARLATLHASGTAPQIVVMQEAFTTAAEQIGRDAGYRYVVRGPDARQHGGDAGGMTDTLFMARARWNHGETEGPVLDSGLVILSDYPIVATDFVVYPRDGCAGYDCLANKGAVLARVAIPGLATPVDIITTHLNCRERTGVSLTRADAAYRRELAALAAFVARAHDPRSALIVAGDFNVGSSTQRKAMIARTIATLHAQPALATVVADQPVTPSDALLSWHKNKDLQLAISSPGARLSVEAISTPFGHESDGSMLSDHVGYIARYRIDSSIRDLRRQKGLQRAAPVTNS